MLGCQTFPAPDGPVFFDWFFDHIHHENGTGNDRGEVVHWRRFKPPQPSDDDGDRNVGDIYRIGQVTKPLVETAVFSFIEDRPAKNGQREEGQRQA